MRHLITVLLLVTISSFAHAQACNNKFLKYSGYNLLCAQPTCSDVGGAASCSTDTTNASNISSGTLDTSRLPDPMTINKLNVGKHINFTNSITPSQITSDQNDYAPTGNDTAEIWFLSSDATRHLTGITAQADGNIIFLINKGSNSIILDDQNTASSASNRFDLAGAGNITILSDGAAMILYAGGSYNRWRYIGGKVKLAGSGSISGGYYGQVLVTTDTSNTTGFVDQGGIAPGRRFACMAPPDNAATTMTIANGGVFGMTASATTNGTAAADNSANGLMIKYTSGTTAGNLAGVNGTYTQTSMNFRPKLSGNNITNSIIAANGDFCFGLTTSSNTTCKVVNASTTCTVREIWIGASQGVMSNDYACCSCDSTNMTCTDMGIAMTDNTSTLHSYVLDYSSSGLLRCTVDSTTVTKTTNLPTATNGFGIKVLAVTHLGGTAAVMEFGSACLEQN